MFLQAGSKPPGGRRRQEFSSRTVANFGASGISNGGSFSPSLRGYRSLSEGRLNFGSGSLYHRYGGCRGSQDMSGGLCRGFCGFGRGSYTYGGEFGCCFGEGYGGTFGGRCFSSPGIQRIQIDANLLQPVHVDLDPYLQQLKHQEKEQLKHLNNQFVSFIDKRDFLDKDLNFFLADKNPAITVSVAEFLAYVWKLRVEYLEKKNTALSTKLQILQDIETIIKRTNLEPVFENYIQNLQKQIECLKSQKGQLQSELQYLEHEAEDCREKYEDEINRRISGENQFVVLKKDVDLAYLRKMQLGAQVDALRSQLAFFTKVFEQELCQMQAIAQHTSVVISMENGRELNAGHMIAEYEYQYQQIAQEAKAHVEAELQQKYEDLRDNAGCQGDVLHKVKQERNQLRHQIQRIRPEIDYVKMQVARLQSAICVAEQKGELDLKNAQKKLDTLKVALQTEKKELTQILQEYHKLWDVKLALGMEITVYQKLLEGEETRLCDGTPGLATVRNENIISSGGGSFNRGAADCEGSVPAGGGMAESGGTSSKRSDSSSTSSSSASSSSGKSCCASEGGGGSICKCRYYGIKKCIKTYIEMVFSNL